MRKAFAITIVVLVAIVTVLLGFNYKKKYSPNTYYKIYLSDKYLGMIKSMNDLYEYIDLKQASVKEKYKVNKVSVPEEFRFQKVVTYNNDLTDIEEIYNKLNEESSFTISAYEYTIDDDGNLTTINVISQEVFKDGVEKVISTFVGEQEYNDYKNDTQKQIDSTGIRFNDIYVEGTITYKNKDISLSKKIYTDKDDLASYLLYSENKDEKTYIVKSGDTISSISYENEISEEEFLMSNPKFSNSQNLVYAGQEVSIVKLNPQIKIVVQEYSVSDMIKKYVTEERHDETRFKGDNEVIQKGEDGLERVAQNITIVNGIIVNAINVSKVELKPSVSEIVIKGDKIIPNVGSLYSWLLPVDSGYRISGLYGWRIDPVVGGRAHHNGIDIAGLPVGSNIYAVNNGTIEKVVKGNTGLGNYVVINHNNGYWSVYGHMIRHAEGLQVGQTVARGQIIGYIGSTGKSTGPHLHLEIDKGCYLCRIDPLTIIDFRR